jgi:hypothetical protein
MYPIFFILFNIKQFKFREKLGLTIVSNLSFYIIIGFIGSWLNLAITFEYFLFSMSLVYFIVLLLAIIRGYRKEGLFLWSFSKKFDESYQLSMKFSLRNIIEKNISLNGILLIIFIVLICIMNLFNTIFFAGVDPWLHISIVRYITEINYLPINEYFGALGLHTFGAVIYFFSSIDLIFLPKCFIFYTVPLCSLILYNIFMRIFKNKNLAIFGIFLLVSSFGFTWFMMVQFWPSNIALIQGLVIFLILYVRLQPLIKEKIPDKEKISSQITISYILSIFIFISSLLTHSLLTFIILISFMWLYLIYFVKNYRRGFDILLVIILLSIFLIFYLFNISTGHFQVFDPFRIIPWYYLLFGAIGIIVIIGLFLFQYRKSMDFTHGKFKSIIQGRNKRIYKKIEDKIIFPLIFGLTIILSLAFSLVNLTLFNLSITYVFYFTEMLLISSFATWGILIFKYKPRGKAVFLWGLAVNILFVLMLIYDAMIGFSTFFLRIYFITAIIIAIGFVSYLYKLIKTNSFQKRKFKVFLIFIVILAVFTQNLFDLRNINTFCLKEQEVSSIQWYSNYTSDENVIISKFGWYAIFIYYDYPFEDKNTNLNLESIHFFLTVDKELVHPSLHISNGSNRLQNLKSTYNTDVLLILPDNYYLPFNWRFFDQLTQEERESYYSLNYFNKILSSKGEIGEETSFYWVI